MNRWMLALAAATAVNSLAAGAHHSISSIYDSSRPVTIEGVVAQFQLVHPHPFLLVSVAGPGNAQQWRLELDNLGELKAIGVTADTLKPGDRVIVRGSPARSQAPSLYVLRLDRPGDGFWYEQVGLSPRIRPRP